MPKNAVTNGAEKRRMMAATLHCVRSWGSTHDQAFSANYNGPMRNCITGPTAQ